MILGNVEEFISNLFFFHSSAEALRLRMLIKSEKKI